jgi:hypothetical protein
MTQQVLPPPPNTPLLDDPTRDAIWRRYIEQLINRLTLTGQIDHNTLLNLQGGTTDQYYHLTSSQHALVTSYAHNNLNGLQGGIAGQYYHLTSSQHSTVTSFAAFTNNRVVITGPTSSLTTSADLTYNSATSTLNAPILVTNGSTVTFTNLSALGGNGQLKIIAGGLGSAGGVTLLSSTASARIAYVDLQQTDGTLGSENSIISFGTILNGALAEKARISDNGDVNFGSLSGNNGELDITSGNSGAAGGAMLHAYLSNVETGYMDLQVTDGTGGAQKSIIRLGTISTGVLGERVRIDDAGRFIRGGVAAQIGNPAGNLLPGFQLHGTTNDFVQMAQYRWTADSGQPVFRFVKSRGASIGTWTLVQNGDNLGSIFFAGADGSVPQVAAGINCVADGTTSTGVMPGMLTFQTAQAGGVTLATALTLDAAQNAFFGKNLTATTGSFSASTANFSGNVTATTGSFTASSGTFSGTLTVSGAGAHSFDGVVQTEMGTSASYAKTIGTANFNITDVANVGSGEDNLMTYSLPANSLTTAKGVRITAWGRFASNVNSKTVKIYFGSIAMSTENTSLSSVTRWVARGIVLSTAGNTQKYLSSIDISTSAAVTAGELNVGDLAETDTSAIVIKCTGEGVADGDIIQEAMVVEFIN